MVSATKEHYRCLQQDVTASDFSATSIIAAISKAEGGLALLSSAALLHKLDVIYSRFAPTDYTELHSITRRLIARASGMNTYYTLIDPTRERFPVTPGPSTPATPTYSSPSYSRPPSPGRDLDQPLARADAEKVNSLGPLDGGMKSHQSHHHHTAPHVPHHMGTHQHKRRYLHTASHHHHHSPPQVHHHTGINQHKRRYLPHTGSHPSAHSHSSLLHLALSRAARTESAVGVFESLHYLNLEATHMSHPDSEAHIAKATELLRTSCQDLLKNCEDGLQGTCDWLGSVRDNTFNFWVSREEKLRIRMDKIKKYEHLHHELSLSLDEFTNKKRFLIHLDRTSRMLMIIT